jgi:hypothetical protein
MDPLRLVTLVLQLVTLAALAGTLVLQIRCWRLMQVLARAEIARRLDEPPAQRPRHPLTRQET